MYDPRRSLCDHFADWTLRWAPMHNRLGLTTYATRTITLHPDPDQAQRRSMLAHELEHVRRGPCAEQLWPREEVIVEGLSARKLIAHVAGVKFVQARLGHATAAATLDRHARLWPDSDDTTRAAVDLVLGTTRSRRPNLGQSIGA